MTATRILVAMACIPLLSAPLRAGILKVPSPEHASIQAAIDAAQPGDTVVVGKGSYVEPLKIIEKTDLVLRAAGKVVLEATEFNTGITVGFSTGIEVSGFTILNAREHSILVGCSEDVTVRKCKVLGGDLDGIRVFSGEVRLEKNTVKDVEGIGIRLLEPMPGEVMDDVAKCGPPVGVVVLKNRVEHAGGDGIWISGTGIVAEGNVVEDVAGDGLVVLAEGAGAIVRKNRVSSPGARGLVVSGAGVSLQKNRIKQPALLGLVVEVGADGASLLGDKVTKPTLHGLQIDASNSTFSGLRVVQAGGHGLLAGGTANVFQNCRSTSAWFAGFNVYATSSSFTGCHATGSGLYDLIDADAGNSTNTYVACKFGTSNLP